jgi:osmotically-inducible protein OsmY
MVALCAAATLVACEREDERTMGQALDENLDRLEQRGQGLAQQAADAADDAGITARLKAALAADPQLSAFKVEVQSRSGHVKLLGQAPDVAARERATSLALAIEGVQTVDNQLQLKG